MVLSFRGNDSVLCIRYILMDIIFRITAKYQYLKRSKRSIEVAASELAQVPAIDFVPCLNITIIVKDSVKASGPWYGDRNFLDWLILSALFL